MCIFVQLCSSWQDFKWLKASRGPSAITELLVTVSYVIRVFFPFVRFSCVLAVMSNEAKCSRPRPHFWPPSSSGFEDLTTLIIGSRPNDTLRRDKVKASLEQRLLVSWAHRYCNYTVHRVRRKGDTIFLPHSVNCGRFCFWRRQSVGFLFVYEISREQLNGFAPSSHRRHVWSPARMTSKVMVKVQGHQNKKRHFPTLSAACVRLFLVKHL